MTSAMHNALRNASLTTRERVLRDIGRKLEPDPIALKPGLVTQMTALSGFPPLKIIRSPEQPRLSERISKIEVHDRKRKMAAIAAAASVIILAVSGCKQANPVRSDVCFVPREPAIEDARGITDGTNEKPVDVTERVVFSSVPNNKYFTMPHIPDTKGDGQEYNLRKRLSDGSSITVKSPNQSSP